MTSLGRINIPRAVAALQNHPVFRNTSARHLTDLVHLAASGAVPVARGQQKEVPGAFLVVTDGRARLDPPRLVVPAGTAVPGVDTGFLTRAFEGSFGAASETISASVTGDSSTDTWVLPLSWEVLMDAARISPSFAKTVRVDPLMRLDSARELTLLDLAERIGAGAGVDGASSTGGLPREPPAGWELIWMCRAPELAAPMEALTILLAAATAEDHSAPTGVLGIAADGRMRVTVWSAEEGRFDGWKPTEDPVASFVGRRYRMFVVGPNTPSEFPDAWSRWRFHRIVYLTPRRLSRMPAGLHIRLKSSTVKSDDRPYFSSFIPSVILSGGPPHKPRYDSPPWRTILSAVLRDAMSFLPGSATSVLGLAPPRTAFRTELLDDGFTFTHYGIKSKPWSPVGRDTCVLRLGLRSIASLWSAAPDPSSFPTAAYRHRPLGAAWKATVRRWGRAVTNKRVGLAVTGGGPTSYRLVSVIRMLEEAGVPLDVVGGLSGGAALGAYYCRDEGEGLSSYVSAAGNRLSVFGAAVGWLTTQIIETATDWMFHGTTLDDLEVRFVPVTTALPRVGAPQPRAVVHGTLGEAVRVSGAFPGMFARTVKNRVLYLDGASATPLPARALPNYGADYVFACNTVPGPDRRNPFDDRPFGDFAYRFTPLGRWIDAFVFQAQLLYRIACESGAFAHEHIEAAPNDSSLQELFWWHCPGWFVEQAKNDEVVKEGVAACAKRWNEVRRQW
jgi:predicted acylesterase/phospholipase RssA